MAGSSSKPRQPPLQKSLSRRVSFNESSLKEAQGRHARPPPSVDSIDTESQISADGVLGGRRRRGGCLSLCSSCCAWTSIIVAVLLTLTLLVGGTFFAYLQSNLPEVRLRRLDIYALEVSGDTLVAADFVVLLNVTNGSGKVELGYSGMTASMAATGVGLGSVRLADMHQQPQNATEVIVHTVAKGVPVEEAAGKELVESSEKRVLVMDVVVKGKIDFFFGGKRSDGWSFKIDCHSIDQMAIDNGYAPKCNTKLMPLS